MEIKLGPKKKRLVPGKIAYSIKLRTICYKLYDATMMDTS